MADNNNNPAGDFETASTSTKINALLQSLLQQNSLLNIELEKNTERYTSILLDADEESAMLVFDAFHPTPTEHAFTPYAVAKVRVQNCGADISFAINIELVHTTDGQVQYRAAYPKSINYLQRRGAFRVPVSAMSPADVYIYLDKGKTFTGALRDISVSGMCIRFPPKTKLPETWPEEVSCEIILSSGKKLRTQFKVCHIKQHQPSRNFFLGVAFLHLDKAQERAIEKLVAELQRKSRQRMMR